MKKILLVALCGASFSFGENIIEKKCKTQCGGSHYASYKCREGLTHKECHEECMSRCRSKY